MRDKKAEAKALYSKVKSPKLREELLRTITDDDVHHDVPEVNWHIIAEGKPGDGKALTMLRAAKGFTIRELGEAAGVSAQAISKYERGLNGLGSDGLLKVSHVLKVPVWAILGWWEIKVADRGIHRANRSGKATEGE